MKGKYKLQKAYRVREIARKRKGDVTPEQLSEMTGLKPCECIIALGGSWRKHQLGEPLPYRVEEEYHINGRDHNAVKMTRKVEEITGKYASDMGFPSTRARKRRSKILCQKK